MTTIFLNRIERAEFQQIGEKRMKNSVAGY